MRSQNLKGQNPEKCVNEGLSSSRDALRVEKNPYKNREPILCGDGGGLQPAQALLLLQLAGAASGQEW